MASSGADQLALVVVPEPELRSQLAEAIESFGVEVIAAVEPREALALMDHNPIGALVVDAQLQTMSGFDLVRTTREHPRGAAAAVIIITGVKWAPFQKAAALHQMGLLDLLVKPVDPTHVAELVVGALTSEPLEASDPEAWHRDTLVDDEPIPDNEISDTLVGSPAPPPLFPEDAPGATIDEANRVESTLVDKETKAPLGPQATLVDPGPTDRGEPTQVDAEPGARKGGAGAGSAAPSTPKQKDDEPTEVGPPPALLADPASRSEKRHVERATRVARAGRAELRGNLTQIPFPRLLHSLYLKRATGALFLLNDRIKKIVYLDEGHPSYIKSNRLSECLGKILVREKMITEAQCKESLKRMAATTRQQGTVLIEMGVISPHKLVVGLERQLRVKLMDIFTWNRGEFLFRREAKVPSDVITLEVSNATLIADGVRSCWDEARLDDALGAHMDRYVTPNPNPEMRFQELSLDPEEQSLLDHVDGTCTLRQILADTHLPSRKAKAVAFALLVTEVVQTGEHPLAPTPLIAGHAVEESLRERLATELISLRQRDAFGVLGVPPGCGDEEVREAHERAARDYHPDRFHHLSAETRRMAQDIFRLFNEAYEKLSTDSRRRRYKRELQTPAVPERSVTGEGALEAERSLRKARRLMARKQWSEARQVLASAVDLYPDAGDLRGLLGWCTYMSAPDTASVVRAAIRELRKAIELEPRRFEAYLDLGRIYAGMGKTILAEKQFEKALQCNPDCQEALDELKIQKERRPSRRFR
jgi:CheY-like chemotaxis protein